MLSQLSLPLPMAPESSQYQTVLKHYLREIYRNGLSDSELLWLHCEYVFSRSASMEITPKGLIIMRLSSVLPPACEVVPEGFQEHCLPTIAACLAKHLSVLGGLEEYFKALLPPTLVSTLLATPSKK